jgi:hypothetical protein
MQLKVFVLSLLLFTMIVVPILSVEDYVKFISFRILDIFNSIWKIPQTQRSLMNFKKSNGERNRLMKVSMQAL